MIDDSAVQGYLRSLPIHESTTWKRRLERHRTDCGCRIGLMVMLAVTAIWMAYPVLGSAGRFGQRSIATGLVVMFVSGLTGKLIGLALARVRFHWTVRSLRQESYASLPGRPAAPVIHDQI
jgi:hypothetical protein